MMLGKIIFSLILCVVAFNSGAVNIINKHQNYKSCDDESFMQDKIFEIGLQKKDIYKNVSLAFVIENEMMGYHERIDALIFSSANRAYPNYEDRLKEMLFSRELMSLRCFSKSYKEGDEIHFFKKVKDEFFISGYLLFRDKKIVSIFFIEFNVV